MEIFPKFPKGLNIILHFYLKMEIKRQESEIKVRFGELRKNKKVVDLRTIDSKYIITALDEKIREFKTKR